MLFFLSRIVSRIPFFSRRLSLFSRTIFTVIAVSGGVYLWL
jgi:cadmium resistance protein CadD (predicted permease)